MGLRWAELRMALWGVSQGRRPVSGTDGVLLHMRVSEYEMRNIIIIMRLRYPVSY